MNDLNLRRWQRRTLALMIIGYSAYYLGRSNLSVATPLLIEEFKGMGVTKAWIGGINSIAVLAYAAGKFLSGSAADAVGGRRIFLFGMIGAALCNIAIGFGAIPVFTIAWCLNRLVQSGGWVGMVRMSSRWFSHSEYAAAMGLVSLSYLLGDAASRWSLGKLIEFGVGWRGLFLIPAIVLAVLFALNQLLLKETPTDAGLEEPPAAANTVYSAAPSNEAAKGSRLVPLLSSPAFIVICLVSLGFTIVRETFQNWTPQFLTEAAKATKAEAAQYSALLPLFGAVSVVFVGFLGDRVGRKGRAFIILLGLALCIPILLTLAGAKADIRLSAILLCMLGFLLIGPYSYLAGSISLDFGGKVGSATAAGWIDGVGYLGGVWAGKGMAKIAETNGWSGAMQTLAMISAATCIPTLLFFLMQARRPRAAAEAAQ